VRISAAADYAVRAVVELAAADSSPTKGETIARAQRIPAKFLESILGNLRHAGIVRSQRGADGGYWLAKPAYSITIADVIRAVEGPMATVRGERPEDVEYPGASADLRVVWIALRANLRAVLETVTVADLASGKLPAKVRRLAADPSAWMTR
jgi:Rrf2 family protein